MEQHLLFAKKPFDTSIQVLKENQIIVHHGMGASVSQDAPKAITGNFIIVDYSEKALAVFGDTKPIKKQLMALGGRFNPKLTHGDQKRAGWIFSKAKEQELTSLLTIK